MPASNSRSNTPAHVQRLQIQQHAKTIQGRSIAPFAPSPRKISIIYGSGHRRRGGMQLGQVAHLDFSSNAAAGTLRRRLNDELPADINILCYASQVPHLFHARHHRSPPRPVRLPGGDARSPSRLSVWVKRAARPPPFAPPPKLSSAFVTSIVRRAGMRATTARRAATLVRRRPPRDHRGRRSAPRQHPGIAFPVEDGAAEWRCSEIGRGWLRPIRIRISSRRVRPHRPGDRAAGPVSFRAGLITKANRAGASRRGPRLP